MARPKDEALGSTPSQLHLLGIPENAAKMGENCAPLTCLTWDRKKMAATAPQDIRLQQDKACTVKLIYQSHTCPLAQASAKSTDLICITPIILINFALLCMQPSQDAPCTVTAPAAVTPEGHPTDSRNIQVCSTRPLLCIWHLPIYLSCQGSRSQILPFFPQPLVGLMYLMFFCRD